MSTNRYTEMDKLNTLAATAVDELNQLIRVNDPSETERFRMTRATSILTSYSRIVEAHARTGMLNFKIAQALAGDDADQLETYVKRAFPAARKMLNG